MTRETVREHRSAEDIGELIHGLEMRLSNWGRWRSEDELDRVNLVTREAGLRAASNTLTEKTISLALPLRSDYPQVPDDARSYAQHAMTETGADALVVDAEAAYFDDAIAMSVHAHTDWDALAHVFHRGLMYNRRNAEPATTWGASASDIIVLSRTMVAHCVLLDRATSGKALPRDYGITVGQLEEVAERQRVERRGDDVLLLRAVHLGAIRAGDLWREFSRIGDRNPFEPGIGSECLPWLNLLGIAAVASDRPGRRGAARIGHSAHGDSRSGDRSHGTSVGGHARTRRGWQRTARSTTAGPSCSRRPLPIAGCVGGHVSDRDLMNR